MAALTIGAPVKWVDNLLSHFHLTGVTRRARGFTRLIDEDGLLVLAVTRLLQDQLGIPLPQATRVALEIVSRPRETQGEYRASRVTLRIALTDLERELQERLRDAAEAVAHVRRGRPPRRAPEIA